MTISLVHVPMWETAGSEFSVGLCSSCSAVHSCSFLSDSGLNMQRVLSTVEKRSSVLLIWKFGTMHSSQGVGELNTSASFCRVRLVVLHIRLQNK